MADDPAMSSARVVLASASPRRRDLLAQLGVAADVRPAHVDESPLPGECPRSYVRRVADAKCAAVSAEPGALVIAADTTVDIPGGGDVRSIAGKPVDVDDARWMLRQLSGRTHRVHTAVVARLDGRAVGEVVTTFVRMVPLSEAAIDWYVATGEPFDKAGGYAIQGAGGVFVAAVRGSVSNVVGLPLHAVVRLAADLGVTLGPGAD